MDSPLQQLLRAVEARCDAAEVAALCDSQPAAIAAVAETARREALCTPLMPDVLAILLQPSVQGCVPDEEHVSSCKQRGAAAFGRGQHRQAAQLFSEALRYCRESCPEGATLAARLYCNRALCLSKLAPPQLEAALQDSSSAIEADPAFAKGYYRRACTAKALAARGGGSSASSAAALQDARRALHLLQEQQAGDTAAAAALVAELEAAAAADVAAGGGGRSSGGASSATQAGGGVYANGHATLDELAAAGADSASADSAADPLHHLLHLAAGGQRLAVRQTEDAGRCLVAAEALSAGNNVLQELPFAHALTKAGRRSACGKCLAPLAAVAAPYYCRTCPMPTYCSAACRDGDRFHRPGGPECCLPWTVLLPAEALAALRLARRLQADASSAAGRQVAALGTHFADLAPPELVQLAALAAVAHTVWQQAAAEAAAAEVASGAQQQAAAAAGAAAEGQQQGSAAAAASATAGHAELSAGGAQQADHELEASITVGDVLGALCRMQVNGLAVVPPERRGSSERQALALYAVGSLLNHSCLPNVAACFQGSKLVVRTIEPVPAGEPLLHCYGPQAGEMTTAQRQSMLRQQYHFVCRCRACSGAEGQLADVAPAGLKCPGGASGARCEGAVLPACAVPAGLLHRYALPLAGSRACCACGAEVSQEDWQQQLLPELQAAADAHASAAALLEQLERQQQQQAGVHGAPTAVQQAVRQLRQCLRQRQRLLHPHNLLLGATHDELAHAWHLAGNREATAQHLRHSLAVLQHSYPPGSTAVAFQQRQLAQMLRLAAAAAAAGNEGAAEQLLAEARQAEAAADAVLVLHFGGGV